MVFLKGYQWPFDVGKICGSSMIDLIVYHEIFEKRNRVFLDFRENPSCLGRGFSGLSEEAHEYLSRSNALFGAPIDRLQTMNPLAIELYKNHGIDLYREPLEISVCAQHNNGGIAVDLNWESSIKGLYAVGEAAGTFGVYRPGGAALNSTQVGSMRAAEHIADTGSSKLREINEFISLSREEIDHFLTECVSLCGKAAPTSNINRLRTSLRKKMSSYVAHIRSLEDISRVREEMVGLLLRFFKEIEIREIQELPFALKTRDTLITQISMLSSMQIAGS